MGLLRRLVLNHRRLAAWLLVATLCMKLVVPAGFMPTMANGSITVAVCSGSGARTMTIALPGAPDHGDSSKDHERAQMPCAFAGLGLPSLAAVDPIVLAIALAFVMAAGVAAAPRIPAATPAYLRPPLRGPPLTA